MPTNESIDTSSDCQHVDSKWDQAIVDAEAELKEIEKRRAGLRRAIQIFRENKRDGVAWPGAAEGAK
jgi:hypothetical protein